MVYTLPRGLNSQLVAKPTQSNIGRVGQAAYQGAVSYASNADNITTGTINPDQLPIATATEIGAISPDEVTIHTDGTTGATNAITATSSSLGIVQPDNVTITIDPSGIISAPGATGGTVTSVGLSLPIEFSVTGSPITTSGTLTATWANENANYFFAGPITGAATTPTFRAMVIKDTPVLGGSPLITDVLTTQSQQYARSNLLGF